MWVCLTTLIKAFPRTLIGLALLGHWPRKQHSSSIQKNKQTKKKPQTSGFKCNSVKRRLETMVTWWNKQTKSKRTKKRLSWMGDVPVLHPGLFHSATPEGHGGRVHSSHPDADWRKGVQSRRQIQKTNKKKYRFTPSSLWMVTRWRIPPIEPPSPFPVSHMTWPVRGFLTQYQVPTEAGNQPG